MTNIYNTRTKRKVYGVMWAPRGKFWYKKGRKPRYYPKNGWKKSYYRRNYRNRRRRY